MEKCLKAIQWVLGKINGKKTTIATILGAFITFSLIKGLIDNDTAQLLSTILVALGLGANVINAKSSVVK